ncbi:styrene monooxygenase/indole monooxygenase family protein [Marinitenerispora sediminis]|uniref:Oxygenase n=1 Tax=Marinitenerispora sediminis TaxID=1931232 RepID=A0A368T1N7_9ACTN|nr:styrene monooxygenase/indole monooxygenase family protein [Marinitenerispora sediminis]RCV53296.1 oxygenase [Marinitenerispora sediminis]RCV54482.1 oxygenase [Marinitenerispora sediminis]RCV58512.1 oxygenase [Marinitenerispora sediminis]
MRRVLIVGSGQSGLQLALGLLDDGYDVTVVSARTPEEIRSGRIMSTQCMFDPALQLERDLGLNLWEDDAPRIEGLGVSIADPPGTRAVDWLAPLDRYAQSVDQRVKMADWLENVDDAGGHIVVSGATVSDLEGFTRLYDLVVVAAGKGELAELFDLDPARTVFHTPQRSLAASYVHGVGPRPEHPGTAAVRCNLVPDAGEIFVMPSYTSSGPCDTLLIEAVPGGPLDVFDGIRSAQEHLERSLDLMRRHTPWEYERCRDAELTDGRAVLAGRFTPAVREPVGRLPGGGLVLGMADVVVTNDPVTGQGANCAAKCADIYRRAIVAHGDQPFDEAFMRAVFEEYWDGVARHVTAWTTAMLRPPEPHVLRLLTAAEKHPEIAHRFGNGFAAPEDFASWLLDPAAADAYLAEVGRRG